MPSALDALVTLLDLERLEENLFRGQNEDTGWRRVFGGQVIGQALVAASRTVAERPVHSLHCYFLRPGDPAVPIIYDVERIRDGGSFTTRRVVAIQHGEPIFSMSASFHCAEEGFDHQLAMPKVPPPEELPGGEELVAAMIAIGAPEHLVRFWQRERPIEVRPERLALGRSDGAAIRNVWIRATGALPDDNQLHNCVLAYASDFALLDTTLMPHGTSVFDRKMMVASLDHAVWFHRPFRADDWLLYASDSPTAYGARGIARGSLFARDGALVASVAQEGLIRRRTR
jgi:acyl-CoA thioesterase-2